MGLISRVSSRTYRQIKNRILKSWADLDLEADPLPHDLEAGAHPRLKSTTQVSSTLFELAMTYLMTSERKKSRKSSKSLARLVTFFSHESEAATEPEDSATSDSFAKRTKIIA